MMAMKEKLANSVDGEELTEALVLIRTRAPDLESVRKLNCWACSIGDVSVVRRIPNLEVCSLTINKLTSLRDFAHCYNLQELYVRTNNIQQLSDIHYLKNLKKLRSLWLSENPCATGANYRMTVLKMLPNLQKLDNIAVTGDEIARAQNEGDELPVPDDFSYSSVFQSVVSSFGDCRDEKKGESVSSEKWARPRQKRQQKKREDYWREIRGADEESGSAKSGDDGGGSSTRSGDEGGGLSVRSSSDSGDGGDWFSSKAEGFKNSSKSDDTGHDHEEEEVYNPQKVDVTVDDQAKMEHNNAPSTKAKWAVKVEIPDNVANPDQNEYKYNNDIDNKMIEENVEENKVGSCCDEKILEKENYKDKEVFAKDNGMQNELSVSSKLYSPVVFHERNFDLSDWSCDNNSLLAVTESSDITPTPSTVSIDVLDITATDCNTSASNNNISLISGSSDIQNDHLNTEKHQNTSATASVKVTSETPLLDKTKLEDSLDFVDSDEAQTCPRDALGSKDPTDLALQLKMLEKSGLPEVPSLQAADTETINTEPAVLSDGENRDPVNWEEYNRMRVQLGVRPVDRISITPKSLNTEVMKARISCPLNSNILQAVLCLVKELDKGDLDIVASAVKGRLDSMQF